MEHVIRTKELTKTFVRGPVETRVLKGIDFAVAKGEFVSIMGRSGAGKSTLLYQISLLDDPTSGEIYIEGREAHGLSAREKSSLRLVEFGYVFQDYALLPELTALENTALPLLAQGFSGIRAYAAAADALSRVELMHRAENLPSQLSGGEQQRAAIARAVAHKPKILFADEPTANLDNESSKAVMEIFTEFHQKGQTIIMVTHEEEYARLSGRIVHIDDGRIV